MKQLLTFQGFPMVVVVVMVAWAWISLLSVLVASFFLIGPSAPNDKAPHERGFVIGGGGGRYAGITSRIFCRARASI